MATSVITSHNLIKPETESWSLPTISSEPHRLNALKSDIHSKGSQLTSTWNDLYRLLSQYQAELFSTDSPNSNGAELRRDLAKKEVQMSQLQHKLNLAENEIERVRLDLTVKNSLLQKYQDDLLEKEAALLTCHATIRKLENKHQLLEHRMGKQQSSSVTTTNSESGTSNSANRRSTTPTTPANRSITPEHDTSDIQGTGSAPGTPANYSSADNNNGTNASVVKSNSKPPKGSLINASISAISQKRKAQSTNSSSKRKSTTPTQNPHLGDDLLQDVLNNVIDTSSSDVTATSLMLNDVKSEPMDSSGMDCLHPGESVFPEPEEAPLPLEQFENWQNDALAQATGEVVVTNKKSPRWEDPLRRHPCPHCAKYFTRPKDVKRHVNTVHLKLKSYGCPSCDKRFTRKEHSVRHLARCLGTYGIPYDASLIETYQRAKPDAEYVRVSGGFQGGASDDAEEGAGTEPVENGDVKDNGDEARQPARRKKAEKIVPDTAAIFPEMYDPAGYPCPTCNRIFTRQTHRKRHIDTMHARVKRHQCLVCGRAFARKDYLTKHFIAHHPELCGDFACPICGKKCLCQDEMTTHVYQCHSVFAPGNEDALVTMLEELKEEAVTAKDLEEQKQSRDIHDLLQEDPSVQELLHDGSAQNNTQNSLSENLVPEGPDHNDLEDFNEQHLNDVSQPLMGTGNND